MRAPCGKLVAGKWQFDAKRGTRCPEAGQVLRYQHDGARPHTERVNVRVFRSHGAIDLNVDDLAFFSKSAVRRESCRQE